MTAGLTVIPVPVTPAINQDDDLVERLVEALTTAGLTLTDGDVVAVASKVVALSEGAITAVAASDDIDASSRARRQVAREQAVRIVADSPRALVVETKHGFVCANAGIDASNVGPGMLVLLPEDPDASAQRLRAGLRAAYDVDVGVLVTDTFGRPWRNGQTDVAVGAAGLRPLRDERGTTDLHDRLLDVTVAAVADEMAGAADLVRAKATATPFVLLRGLDVLGVGAAAELVRPSAQDLFPAGGPTLFEHAVDHRVTGGAWSDVPPDPEVVADVMSRLAACPCDLEALAAADRPSIPGLASEVVVVSIRLAGSNLRELLAVGAALEDVRIIMAGHELDMVQLDSGQSGEDVVLFAIGQRE